MTIYNKPYSFLQLNPLGTISNNIILPFAATQDLRFQFVLELANSDAADAVMTTDTPSIRVVNGTVSILNDDDIIDNTLHNYLPDNFRFVAFRLSPTKVLLYWPHGLPNFSNYLSVGRCFKIVFAYQNVYGDIGKGISNTFKRVDDMEYTTAITYSCDENSYEFNYWIDNIHNTINTIRLPFYLKKMPQFPDEETNYVRSDGSIKVLKSVTKKEYSCVTDYLDAPTHEKLKIALSSDNVYISGNTYVGHIRKNGGYEIEPVDVPGDIDIAQAKFKVWATPYNVRNQNCGTC